MSATPRLILASTIASLLIAGCAHQPAARTTPVVAAPPATTTVTSQTAVGGSTHVQHHAAGNSQAAADASLPDHTGIAACDDYLSSYMACHRAAAIFAPGQLPARYQAMRTSLLRDSQDPDIRPQLAARCNSLASQLRDALHGKSCAENPAPATTP
jgi:hypothetical protein